MVSIHTIGALMISYSQASHRDCEEDTIALSVVARKKGVSGPAKGTPWSRVLESLTNMQEIILAAILRL